MGKLNFIKTITPDSLRGIGQNYLSLSPQNTIIAGNCNFEISKAAGLKSYKIGRIKVTNAFALYDGDKVFYLYVNPNYKNYRKLFKKVVHEVPDNFHVDHLLSRNLANHFKFQYVLICSIPNGVNIRHGRFEKIKLDFKYPIPPIAYLDERIYDKLLSRNPTARRDYKDIIIGYNPISIPKYGLTLKQKGIWNSGFGFHRANIFFIKNNFIPLD